MLIGDWLCNSQEMQSELDAARTEIKRQSSDLELSSVEQERLSGKLKAAEGMYSVYKWVYRLLLKLIKM